MVKVSLKWVNICTIFAIIRRKYFTKDEKGSIVIALAILC